MSHADIDRTIDNAVYGHLKFLYVSPERLKTDMMLERLPKMPVNLIAVDEAHCISQWGYDFRPAYLEIAAIRDILPQVPLMALTATATPEVVDDIQEKLAFRPGAKVWKKSFTRENLAYVVRRAEGKIAQVVNILERVPGTSVVYARNRKKCKDIAVELMRRGIPASYYHAGLDMDTRNARQEAWINGQVRVMVSTNAFGMGIDKADVRTVIHLDLPDSLEAYFQEAGRAGRDGEKAYAILLYAPPDKDRLLRNYELSFPELEDIRRVYRALGSYLQLATGAGIGASYDFDLAGFAQTFQLDATLAYHSLKVLEQSGWLTMSEAVYIPSTLKVLVDKDTLYDYQLKHPKYDVILKVILRTYQGAFSHPVAVREKQLAQFLKIQVSELRSALMAMHRSHIIRYTPATDNPQLTFTQDRVAAEHLTIDMAAYRFRKERQWQRIQAAIRYVESSVCRSKLLVRYFGETTANDCGHCDVCTERRKKGLTTDAYSAYSHALEKALEAFPLALEDIVRLFPTDKEQLVLETLTYLMEEGQVQKDANGRIEWV
ncbi:MAG: RecQ family ATP-dependent DNA helicase [Saprospiraceae bacterium]